MTRKCAGLVIYSIILHTKEVKGLTKQNREQPRLPPHVQINERVWSCSPAIASEMKGAQLSSSK